MPNRRKIVAIIAIAALISTVYIFSIAPYLLDPKRQGFSPAMEFSVPVLSLALIVALVFLVPKRKEVLEGQENSTQSQEKEEEEEKHQLEQKRTRDMAEHRFHMKSLLSGAIGGAIAALILVGLIIAGDVALGFLPGTLYSIIGSTMAGLAMPYSMYFGVGMHLVTGTLVGAVFGYITAVLGVFDITSLRKGTLLGILAGIASFSLLFIPITRFGVENSLTGFLASMYPPGTSQLILENRARDIMSTVLAGAILFHVIYGAIMGFITSVLVLRRSREKEEKKQEEKKNLTGAY